MCVDLHVCLDSTGDLRHRSGSVSSGTQYDGSVSIGHFAAVSDQDISFDSGTANGIREVRAAVSLRCKLSSIRQHIGTANARPEDGSPPCICSAPVPASDKDHAASSSVTTWMCVPCRMTR